MVLCSSSPKGLLCLCACLWKVPGSRRPLTQDGEDDHKEQQQQQDVHEGRQGLEDLPQIPGQKDGLACGAKTGSRPGVASGSPRGATLVEMWAWGPSSGILSPTAPKDTVLGFLLVGPEPHSG